MTRRSHSRSPASDSAAPATLPAHLARWAAERPRGIALRHKTLGVWKAWTWFELQNEVVRLAAALSAGGFQPEDVIVVAAGLSPLSVAVSLAAQSLGGAALWLDDPRAARPAGQTAAITTSRVGAPRFAFAEDEAALARARAQLGSGGPWALAIVTAEHATAGEGAASAVRAYADVVAEARIRADAISPGAGRDAAAFVFLADPVAAGTPTVLTQSEAIVAAGRWLGAERVDAGVQAFAWEGPTTAPSAIFLTGWLLAGFTLGFPEDPTTADLDRRELQPTVVAASGGALGRLWERIVDGLPVPGTVVRRIVNAGMAAAGRGFRGFAGWWLVRRPLRRVLGLRETEVALVLGGPPVPAAAQNLFAQMRIRLRALPAAELTGVEILVHPTAADTATRFEPALAVGPAASRTLA